jgi:hypothetical protein
MHGFSHAGYLLTLGLISVISSMAFWFRDVISEGTYNFSCLNLLKISALLFPPHQLHASIAARTS